MWVTVKHFDCTGWYLREKDGIGVQVCSHKGRLFYEITMRTRNKIGFDDVQTRFFLPRKFSNKSFRRKLEKNFAKLKPTYLAMGLTEDEIKIPWRTKE